jgi:hypothetical protein
MRTISSSLPAEFPEGPVFCFVEFFIRAILSDGTEHFHYATEMFSIPRGQLILPWFTRAILQVWIHIDPRNVTIS